MIHDNKFDEIFSDTAVYIPQDLESLPFVLTDWEDKRQHWKDMTKEEVIDEITTELSDGLSELRENICERSERLRGLMSGIVLIGKSLDE